MLTIRGRHLQRRTSSGDSSEGDDELVGVKGNVGGAPSSSSSLALLEEAGAGGVGSASQADRRLTEKQQQQHEQQPDSSSTKTAPTTAADLPSTSSSALQLRQPLQQQQNHADRSTSSGEVVALVTSVTSAPESGHLAKAPSSATSVDSADEGTPSKLPFLSSSASSLSECSELSAKVSGWINQCNGKKALSVLIASVILFIIYDTIFTPKEQRLIQPDFCHTFLVWVHAHPTKGLVAFLFVIAVAVVFMIPIGTPLTIGCGYIYREAYGMQSGVAVATAVSMVGSGLGALCCFLLGRYLMRDQVRKWIRKYPIFDAIDAAAAENGLKIMAMLYLTPILPLGPVSYMCGTTSMQVSSFVIAKIASLPLMMLYVFIGASTAELVRNNRQQAGEGGQLLPVEGGSPADPNDEFGNADAFEGNPTVIIMGILLSAVMIAFITHSIRKELNKPRASTLPS